MSSPLPAAAIAAPNPTSRSVFRHLARAVGATNREDDALRHDLLTRWTEGTDRVEDLVAVLRKIDSLDPAGELGAEVRLAAWFGPRIDEGCRTSLPEGTGDDTTQEILRLARLQPADTPDVDDAAGRAIVAARLTARMLLEIGAVNFNTDTPYTLASGLPSPSYIDCRKLISYPRIRSTLMDFLTITVMRNAGFEAFDNIAGGETAGIPFAALVAERMALPMTYVRKKPKGYGRNARIEGDMSEGQRVLLVEDLTTDGGSKLSFVDAIRETGATCGHTAVIFYYGIFPETTHRLADHGIALHHLCTWWDVLAEARTQAAFDEKTLTEVEAFLNDPRAWQAARAK